MLRVDRVKIKLFLYLINTLRTTLPLKGFSLLNMADRSPVNWLLEHDKLQHTIHLSGTTQVACSGVIKLWNICLLVIKLILLFS